MLTVIGFDLGDFDDKITSLIGTDDEDKKLKN